MGGWRPARQALFPGAPSKDRVRWSVHGIDHQVDGGASSGGHQQAIVFEPVNRGTNFLTCAVIVACQVLFGQPYALKRTRITQVEYVG